MSKILYQKKTKSNNGLHQCSLLQACHIANMAADATPSSACCLPLIIEFSFLPLCRNSTTSHQMKITTHHQPNQSLFAESFAESISSHTRSPSSSSYKNKEQMSTLGPFSGGGAKVGRCHLARCWAFASQHLPKSFHHPL